MNFINNHLTEKIVILDNQNNKGEKIMKVLKIVESHLFKPGDKLPKGTPVSEYKIKHDSQLVCIYDPKRNEFMDDAEFSLFNKNKHVLVVDNIHYRVVHINDKS